MARKTFRLDKREGKFMGVCAGIANYTGVDATWVRVGAVLVTLLGAFPWTLIAYGVAAWAAKPMRYDDYENAGPRFSRTSTHEVRETMRDIDRRMAEVETYVTNANSSLASEIEKLR